MEKFISLVNQSILENTFIQAIWSNPRNSQVPFKKINVQPIIIRDTTHFQFSLLQNNQETHHNILPTDITDFILENCIGFKQVQLFTSTADYHCLVNKKNVVTIKRKAPTKQLTLPTSHNRQKNYILDTDKSHTFLKQLGLMDQNGKIKPSKYDKYKQINKYLETIATILPLFDTQQKVRIIDFGCGKSYLTFAMYHYFCEIHDKEVEIIGLDLKEDVIRFCQELATTLGYDKLHFQIGDIGKYTSNQPVDVVVSLHACNTATDAAIAKAINWQAKVILAVPCCHQEAYPQIKHDTFKPVLKHGILKERIAALVTDGLRAQLMEACGYKVNVMEFIDMAHTPKNILIKAVATSSTINQEAYVQYRQLEKSLNLDLSLHHLLEEKLPQI